ncbi:MAG: hypothetical protein OK455_06410 [Thaumarchaeota archaeon]|nr:hypothetical protein [Nitrososphaerota archaeon]
MSTISTEVADFVAFLETKGRRVFVAEDVIDLSNLDRSNNIFVLQMPGGSTAAGGRGGGFGERRVVKVYHYALGKGTCMKVAEYEDELRLEALDLPYHATAFPIILPDGKEKLVSGVVDRELVGSYRNILEQA